MKIASSIRKIVTDRLAIDLGASRTVIAVEGEGIVLDEPSYIVVNELTGDIVAYGQEAYDMQGREGRNLKVVTPIRGGVISDFERAKSMLAHFVRKSKMGSSRRFLTHAIIGLVSDITFVEQRALMNAASEAGIHKTYAVEAGLAAAFGAGVIPSDKRASGIVDIGAGATKVAVVAKGSVVYSRSMRTGLEDITTELSDHIRRKHTIELGASSVEKLKLDLASLSQNAADCCSRVVRGRDLLSGSPVETEVSSLDIYPVVERTARKIGAFIKDALNESQPEVSADLFERGLILTGSGSQLTGLDDYLRRAIHLPVILSADPTYATVRGMVSMFDEPELLRKVTGNESNLTHAQVPFQA